MSQPKRFPKLTTSGGFRFIRAFSIDHNADRFRTYVKKLGHEVSRDRSMRKLRFKNRRRAGQARVAQA